ncbi:hypothetical protein [Tautonia sociabilis]|uniref:Uncharacterized protein n=1 Tax=Tautonia sociabilis TaxID=2080755 RepID=A0A432MPF1_9BACT|nr:hypothetical protein [Tautonia sociabilis]RUL89210.1 hypothetical protein TsocGM_03590 [Tautonia sociabilis]
MLARFLPRAALASGIAALASVISPRFAAVLGGFFAGMLIQEAVLTARTVRVIPLLLRVFDWHEVDRLLNEAGGKAP